MMYAQAYTVQLLDFHIVYHYIVAIDQLGRY